MLFFVGAVVSVISSALGLGGAFLIVPFLVVVYKLPMYCGPGGDDPLRHRALRHRPHRLLRRAAAHGAARSSPNGPGGFFAAAGGIFDSWVAAKTSTCPSRFSTHARRGDRRRRAAVRGQLFLRLAVQGLRIFAYLPFLVLAAAMLVAAYRISVC